jgi:hydroxypyruvate reductase/glycerate 2-kinase
MIIKNKKELSTSQQRAQLLELIETGLEAVKPKNIFKLVIQYNPKNDSLKIFKDKYDLKNSRIFIIGGGKAAGAMAEAIEHIITPEKITAGIVNCNCINYKTEKIQINHASHPIPDQEGLNGVQQMLKLKESYSINRDDLVICLISGGGSAIMPCPVDGVTLEDIVNITDLLIHSGAEIAEINRVRSHISKIKGGRLASYFSPARIISLIISDVVDNDLAAIASGPTHFDTSAYAEAYGILERYDLISNAPENVLEHLKNNLQTQSTTNNKTTKNVNNYIIADNKLVVDKIVHEAKQLGLRPKIITHSQKGDTTEVANSHAQDIIAGKYQDYDLLLIAGETTLQLCTSHGAGGRNQHYIATTLFALGTYHGKWLVASIASDGADFMADVAGAMADNESWKKAVLDNLNVQYYLERFDSFTLLKKLGNSLIITEVTDTNVGDIIVYHLEHNK